jgi:hypothetical protein
MLGFDGQDSPGFNYNVYAGTNGYDPLKSDMYIQEQKWFMNRKQIFDVYNDVEFFLVTKDAREKMPEIWKGCPNVKRLSRNQFVQVADL